MSRLWYDKPANSWEEALPIGNGRMGAMIFGKVNTERIQLNEDSVWYGAYVERNNPHALRNLSKIRELILSGQIPEAEELMIYALSGIPQSQRPYQSLGDLTIDFKGMEGDISGYKRSLSLDDAVHSMEAIVGNNPFKRETFLSKADDVMVIRITSGEKQRISFSALLTRERFYDSVTELSEDTIMLRGNLGKGGIDFAMMVKAVVEGGSCEVIGEHLIVKNADAVTLLFTAGTTFRFEDLEKDLRKVLSTASEKSYDQLKQNHIKDYKALYSRVEFNLDGIEKYESLTTAERMKNAEKGQVDKGMAKLYFDYGRYLLIACSREGSLPANLQGIWNKDMTPPWDSKYTININAQMNYWPAEICNLSECHRPLFDFIKRMVPNGQKTAKVMYDCRGFVAHHNTDMWGDTAVQDHWIPSSYWVMGAAWLCTHQWTHYEYTKDLEFLKEAFPIMREAALFFLDFLIDHNGYLVTCPSVSPENTYILPTGVQGAVTFGATMDNQILRDLFTQCLKAAEILEVDDELNNEIKKALDKLIPTRIGKRGGIMEWMEDYDELEPGHRHVSHLYGLHPSSQITMDDTPDLARAARRTLELRLASGGGHTGWSRAWIINLYAKLWDGAEAYKNLELLISKSTLTNMFDNHPPFQIDGNFGGTAAIAKMLVQSSPERIVLLPALPNIWKDGSIKGLCVRGGAELSIKWANCQLTTCIIKAKHRLQTELVYKDKRIKIALEAGEELQPLL
ncbi:MAG: glycoside hydrolase family 95 protein [Clostridiales bacterium]|nr:glycoside hydrolase family 95 protein [Clostridiales bacterium]